MEMEMAWNYGNILNNRSETYIDRVYGKNGKLLIA